MSLPNVLPPTRSIVNSLDRNSTLTHTAKVTKRLKPRGFRIASRRMRRQGEEIMSTALVCLELTDGRLPLLDGTSIVGNLNLGGRTTLCELPNRLFISAHLNLSRTTIERLPEELYVGGNLDLSDSKVSLLPKTLHVGGSIDLSNSHVTSIPRGLDLSGDVNLINAPIYELPDDIKIGGNLYLGGAIVPSVPSLAKIGGKIYITVRHA